VLPRALSNVSYIVAGFGFGAILPTLIALLVVMPIKGQPIAGGGDAKIVVGALILNGLWGAGTALFIKLSGPAAPSAVKDGPRTDVRRI